MEEGQWSTKFHMMGNFFPCPPTDLIYVYFNSGGDYTGGIMLPPLLALISVASAYLPGSRGVAFV